MYLATLEAGAGENPDKQNAAVLFLDEAISLCIERNTDILSARKKAEAFEARLKGAQASPNPELVISGVWGNPEERANAFNQLIEIAGEKHKRTKKASYELESVKSQYEDMLLSVLSNLKKTYLDVARREAVVQIIKDAVALSEDFLRITRNRFEIGDVNIFPVLQGEAELAKVKLEYLEAERTLSQSQANLNKLLRRDLATSFKVEPPSQTPQELPPLKELNTQVLSRHPDIQEAKTVLGSKNYNIALAQTQRSPKLLASIYRSSLGRAEEQGGSLSLIFPLWDNGSIAGAVLEARKEKEEQEALLQSIEQTLLLKLYQAYQQRKEREEAYHLFQKELVTKGESLVRLTQKGYQTGATSYLEALEAERTLRDTRKIAINLFYDLWTAQVELEEATGTMPVKIAISSKIILPSRIHMPSSKTTDTSRVKGGENR